VPADSIRVVLQVTDVLDRLHVTYAVEGVLGSSDYGITRSSLDAHIIADMRLEHVEPFIAALSVDFYADHHMIEDAIERRGSFTLVHYASKFNVDVFIPKLRPFDQMQFKRRRASALSAAFRREVTVTSPEDAILSKLERYRLGGATSEHAWKEVLGLLKVAELDMSYLRQWAGDLNVEDLLDKALKEV
jgi:hypothetical protein